MEYIVQNTVGAKLEEIKAEFIRHNQHTLAAREAAISAEERRSLNELLKTRLFECVHDAILNLSVLDPAMGSGHFLVNATNHLANFTTEFLNDFEILADDDSSTKVWRRRIVEHCIYGVDLNPLAVELSKLSLWILSMAKDQALSFLNHHLKCGNSLIGAQIKDIGTYPLVKKKKDDGQLGLFEQDKRFRETIQQVIDRYRQIAAKDSSGRSVIDDKKQWLEEVNIALQPYKAVFDFHTSLFFGHNVSYDEYDNTLLSFTPEFTWDGESYFHWELEFPEVLLQKDGFDVVIGNPPYGAKMKKKSFLKRRFPHTSFGKY